MPGREEWLPFRDVFEVNGRAVRDRNERLQKLFVDAPTSALTNAARMTSESSRYNIGSIIRTINVPTFALMLLRPGYLKRFEFLKRGDEMIRDVMAWRVEFVERGRPTVVRTLRGEDVPLEGSLWIEPPWVPERMSEWARAANLAVVSSTATYVNFRRFEATGRIVQ